MRIRNDQNEQFPGHSSSRRALTSAGFTLIELLVVVGVTLIIAAFAVPTMTTTIDAYRLRGGMNGASNLAQMCRLAAIKNDSTQRLHFTSVGNRVVLFSTSSTDTNTTPTVGDASMTAQFWLPQQFSTPGVPTGGPTQLTGTSMWGTNLTPNTDVDIYFNSRGFPCLPVAGANCALTNGFVYYFKYSGAGAKRWVALSISPAGRIETWFWNGAGWGN